MMEIDRGETFVAAPGAAHYERSGLAKAVAIPSLPPIQMVWVARSFALLPDTATEFLAICNEIVTRR